MSALTIALLRRRTASCSIASNVVYMYLRYISFVIFAIFLNTGRRLVERAP